MTRSPDRQTHAEALQRHRRSAQGVRFKQYIATLFGAVALGAMGVGYLSLDKPTVRAAVSYGLADAKDWLLSGIVADPHVKIEFEGQHYNAPVRAVIIHPYFASAAERVLLSLLLGSGLGLSAWLVGMGLSRQARTRNRDRLLADRWLAGTRLTSEARLASLTAKGERDSCLSIGTVPIPRNLETRHLAMVGTTGSGKTTALRQLLDGIEARGEPALVYDTSGEFIAHYYRPERGDVILNPFDARCAYWTPFAEMGHPADADRLAQQLVPATGQAEQDVWLTTARILVANMIRALWREGKCTLSDLLDALQDRTKDDLKEWLAGSSSARTFADDADRATGSVLFMLARAANLLQFLQTGEEEAKPFAFRDFVGNLDSQAAPRPWIFVPRKEDFFEASKPLLACWLECAASAVLGLSPSSHRRIWFILDELADLPRVDNLARLLPEGRKFGAGVILTFQAVGQMQHRYGREVAEAMLGCCNTKLFLQTIDGETRQWASKAIGECEVEVQTMTDALAEGDDKARTTLGRQRKTRPAVLESELRLPKFEGYLLLPDGLPVARIKLMADHIAKRGKPRHPGFLPADVSKSLWELAASSPAPSTSQGPV